MVRKLIVTDMVKAAICKKVFQGNLSLAFFSCLVLLLFVACSVSTPPSDLLGVWKTSGENYEDRYIEITTDSLIFGVGEGTALAHTITDISSEHEGSGIRYTFQYLDQDGEEWSLSLLYSHDNGGTIVLQNRNEVWMKEEQP